MIEINLIPDVKRELLRARTMRNFVISIATLVGVVAIATVVVLGVIVGGQIAAESWQDGAIKDNNSKLMAVQDLDKAVTMQHQLKSINEQHTQKTIPSRILDVVSAINPPAPNDVKISILKFDPEQKTIALEGSALNGYAALEVFKKTIMNTKVRIGDGDEKTDVALAENVQSGATSFGENAEGKKVLRFAFTFTYPDELLAVADRPVSIVTPTGQRDVTDSRLGIPESLFGGPAKDVDQKENNNAG